MTSKLVLLLFPFFLFSSAAGHNITKILSEFPDFSSLNSLLTQTQLASEINSRRTITVLAVDNSALSSVSGQPADVVKNVLSLHVVLDYYDSDKLSHLSSKSIIVTTLFQASGLATGQTGFLNVSVGNGQVSIGSAVPGSGLNSHLVKSVASQPYNISVIQVSSVIVPPGISGSSNHSAAPGAAPKAPAPAVSPSPSAGGSPTPTESKSPSPAASSPTPSPSEMKSPPPAAGDAPVEAPSSGSPAPSTDGPVASSPSPSSADAPGSESGVADAPGPGPAMEADSTSSGMVGCMVVRAGLGVAFGAAFLGAF